MIGPGKSVDPQGTGDFGTVARDNGRSDGQIVPISTTVSLVECIAVAGFAALLPEDVH